MQHRHAAALDRHALHICIDMQRLFLEPGVWHVSTGVEILPKIEQLCAHVGKQTVFTKFTTPKNAAEKKGHGRWEDYYRRWPQVTQENITLDVLDLHPNLAQFSSSDRVFDKGTYSAFSSARFAQMIEQKKPSALVFTGVETDACVLATVFSAVDLGYRCIVATDGTTSSSEAAHLACIKHIYTRFDMQIELATVSDIISQWNSSAPHSALEHGRGCDAQSSHLGTSR